MIVSSQVKLDSTIWGCSFSNKLNDKIWKLNTSNPTRWCFSQSLKMAVRATPNFNLRTSATVSEKASNLLNQGPVKRGRVIESSSLFKREVPSPPGIAFASPEGKKLFSKGLPGTSEQKWTHEGLITESLPNGMFRVRLDNEDVILGHVSGKIRRNNVRILPGDKVKIEVSRYDSTRGRIIYRLRSKDPQ